MTFVEIYNNYIYDLFDDDILNKYDSFKEMMKLLFLGLIVEHLNRKNCVKTIVVDHTPKM